MYVEDDDFIATRYQCKRIFIIHMCTYIKQLEQF